MRIAATPVSRRRLLAIAAGVGAGAALCLPGGVPRAVAADDPYETILARAQSQLAGAGFDAADPDFAAALAAVDRRSSDTWKRMDRSASRTAVFPDLTPVADAAMYGQSYQRLRGIATGWATPGTALYASAEVEAELLAAMRFLHDNVYSSGRGEVGSWWYAEIGAPRALVDLLVLLRHSVPDADRAAYLAAVNRFCPNPDRRTLTPSIVETGANRSDKAAIVALAGALGKDPARIALARDGLSDIRGAGKYSLFTYVTSFDGLYPDGSFVQHGYIAYTGTYGQVTLSGVAVVAALLAGTEWAITDPGISVIHDAVERTFAPISYDGLAMDTVRGRAVSRQRAGDYVDGAAITSRIMLLATGAPAEYADRWRALVKGWLQRNELHPYASLATLPDLALAKQILNDPSVVAAPRLTGHFSFADMDRAVHRRPGWALALSLSSKRIGCYEAGNGENQRGWYQGDGMTYLYAGDDLGQFSDAYWPTVDPYRMPGTTIDTRVRAEVGTGPGTGTYRPPNSVAGGAVLDSRFGTAALDLYGAGSTLRARKAWFFLDDAVVCLGNGITSTDGRTIETVVENRNLGASPDRLFQLDGVAQPATEGWSATPDSPAWAHLDGTGGYVFPDPADAATTLRVLRENRAGTWYDINDGVDTRGTRDEVTRPYLTLWFDHGASPAGGSYSYVLLPAASAAETRAFAGSRPVVTEANDAIAQAVSVRSQGLTAAHFWQAGTAAGITADGPAAVVVTRRDDGIRVAVADPGRTATTVTVTLPFATGEVVSADPTVTAVPGRRTVLTVRTAGSRGHSYTAHLACPA
ncbi:polysaccharide lyase 8 family protein [Streptomyces sp. NPDC051940]|uniref:polysaccharide lyase 8 family protein n=1 Tax=Streptomyces sp. NPDC051940 TaxID=3155675 RepID=UPI00342EBBE7